MAQQLERVAQGSDFRTIEDAASSLERVFDAVQCQRIRERSMPRIAVLLLLASRAHENREVPGGKSTRPEIASLAFLVCGSEQFGDPVGNPISLVVTRGEPKISEVARVAVPYSSGSLSQTACT